MTLSVPLLLNPSFLSLCACLRWQFALVQARLQLLLSLSLHCSIFVNCCAVFILRSTSKLPHADFHAWTPVVFWQSSMIPSNTKLWSIPTSWSVYPCDLRIFLIFCIKYIAYSIIRKINSVTLFMFISTALIMEFVVFSSPYPAIWVRHRVQLQSEAGFAELPQPSQLPVVDHSLKDNTRSYSAAV